MDYDLLHSFLKELYPTMSVDVPAFYGSHILGTSSLRIFDASMDDSYDKEVPESLVPTSWSIEAIKGHIQTLLNLLPRKLDCIVFVNDGLFKIEQTQAAVDAVTKGTIVRVIPALMARFLYVTHNIQPPLNEDQSILILTKVSEITDFHILQRKNGIYNFVHEFLGWPANVAVVFDKYAAKYVYGDAGKGVIIYDELNVKVKDECVEKCPTIDIFQTICPKWDEMLLSGGLNKASTVVSADNKAEIDVQDFTIGCQLNVGSGNDAEKIVLIPVSATIPLRFCKELELDNHVHVKVRSNCTTILKGNAHKRLMNPYYNKKLDQGKYLLCIEIKENGVEEVSVTKVKSDSDLKDIKKSFDEKPEKVHVKQQPEQGKPFEENLDIQMEPQNVDTDLTEAPVGIPEAQPSPVRPVRTTPQRPHEPSNNDDSNEQHRQQEISPRSHHHRSSRSPNFENSAQRHERQPPPHHQHQRQRSPLRRRNSRSRSPERNNHRSRSPERNNHRSRSPLDRGAGENRRKSSADSSTIPAEVAEQKSLILPNAADFMICLNERHCCFCLPAEGNTTTRIANVNGNKWTPMYVSFLKVPPVLGEVAKSDLNVNPQGVLYDICTFLTTPFRELQINPEWKFGVAYTGKKREQTVLEVQTWKGMHAIFPVNVLALVFVGLHKEAERAAGKQLKRVFVKKTRPVGKDESAALKEAIRIARLECAGIETMPNLFVE